MKEVPVAGFQLHILMLLALLVVAAAAVAVNCCRCSVTELTGSLPPFPCPLSQSCVNVVWYLVSSVEGVMPFSRLCQIAKRVAVMFLWGQNNFFPKFKKSSGHIESHSPGAVHLTPDETPL